MTLHCSATMEGRRRELEVGVEGGSTDNGMSECSRLLFFHPPRLDGDVPRRLSERKGKDGKRKGEEGKEERKDVVEEGWEVVRPCLVVRDGLDRTGKG